MSKERFCPECGQPADADERFCRDCGAEVPFESNDDTTTAEEMLNKVKPSGTTEPIIGAGARANVSGGINQSSTTMPTSIRQVSITLPRFTITRPLSWKRMRPNTVKYVEILLTTDTPDVPNAGKRFALIVK